MRGTTQWVAAIVVCVAACGAPQLARAADAPPGMNVDRLDRLIHRVDAKATREGNGWQLEVAGTTLQVITDPAHDRMRIIAPVVESETLTPATLGRLLQADFDTALDARYAIARGVLWAAFIHPLSALTDEQFLSGLGQTVNLVQTYGTTFSSGVLSFGGGDSGKLVEELLQKGKGI